jgi:hypothetical protein
MATDRFNGVVASKAIKVRCVVGAEANVATLEGEQTIESIACSQGDRVLLTAQTDPVENGVWDVVSGGPWTRAADWDGNRDIEKGTTVWAGAFGQDDKLWQVQTDGTIVIGSTAVTITELFNPAAPSAASLADVTSVGDDTLGNDIIVSGVDPSLTLQDSNNAGATATGNLIFVDSGAVEQASARLLSSDLVLESVNGALQLSALNGEALIDSASARITGPTAIENTLTMSDSIYWPDSVLTPVEHLSFIPVASGGVPATDPNIASVVLLISGETGDNLDESFVSDIGGHTFTKSSSGVAQLSNNQAYFGSLAVRSYYPSGVNYGNWTGSVSDDWDLGSGDWTIEFDIYRDTVSGDIYPIERYGGAGSRGWQVHIGFTGRVEFTYSTDGTNQITPTFAQTSNTIDGWMRLALVRSGNNLYTFEDGVQIGTTQSITGTIFNNSTTPIGIRNESGITDMYLDNMRITKGVARYTSNYTVETAPFDGTAGDDTFIVGDPGFPTLIDGSDLVLESASGNLELRASNGYVYVPDHLVAGDPGTEGAGITINGVTYDSALKVSDLGNTNLAEFILHRHSSSLPATIVSARSASTDATHGTVGNNSNLFLLAATGWDGATYQRAAEIDISTDGVPGLDDMPGRITFRTTPAGGVDPVERMRIDGSALTLTDGMDLNMSSPNGLDSMVMNLDDLDANMTFAGTVTDLNITVQNGIRLNDESTWFTSGNDSYLRGDSSLYLGYGGSTALWMNGSTGVRVNHLGVEAFRSASRAEGGGLIYNDYSQRDTGAFERILSQSDLEAGQFRLHYTFNTAITATDPGVGFFKMDAATIAAATNIYIDDLSVGELDASRVLSQLVTGDVLRIASVEDETIWLVAQVGVPVDNTGWWTLPITVLASNGTNFSNHQCVIDVQWNSTAGAGVPDGSADGQLLVWDQTTDQEWKVAANISWDGSQLLLPIENDALTPTLAFGDGDTGFYELSDDLFRLSIAGTAAFQFFVNATRPQITGTNSASFHCTNVSTSRTVATIGPRRSVNTGIGSGAADEMSLIAGGIEILRIEETSTNDHIKALFPIYHLERAIAQPDIAAYGQFWVRNDAPNTPMFTDDTGVDHVLNGSGADVTGTEVVSGDWVFTNNTGVTGTESALRQDFLYIDGKEAIDGSDAFLRLNQNVDFASGVYTPGPMRIDGQLNVRPTGGASGMTQTVTGTVFDMDGGSALTDLQISAFTGYVHLIGGVGFKIDSVGSAGDVAFDNDGTTLDIVATSVPNLDIQGFTRIDLGSFAFDADQVVGVGQDNYVLTYDNGTGLISLEAGAGAGSLAGLTDTNITTPGNGAILMWDSTPGEWVDATTLEAAYTFSNRVLFTGSVTGQSMSVSDDINLVDNAAISLGTGSGGTGDIRILFDGTEVDITALSAQRRWNFFDGPEIRLWDSTDTDWIQFRVTTTNLDITESGLDRVNFPAAGTLDLSMNDNTIDQPILQDYAIESQVQNVSGTTVTFSYANGPVFECDMEAATGNVTATLSGGPPSGTHGQITVKMNQDTTVRTLSWAGGTFRWAGGTAHPITTTANGWSIYTFETWDGGTTWYGAGADYS